MRHTRVIVTHYGGPDALQVVEEECPSRWGSGLAITHSEEIWNWWKHSDHLIAVEGIPQVFARPSP